MKTEVIMERTLFNMPIKQKSKSEFLSATDLVKAGNKWRALNGMSSFILKDYFRQKGVIDFMEKLKEEYGTIKVSGKGRSTNTWVHPYLFLDIALAINPVFKVEVYKWLYDLLLKYRNDSGDSYNKMCGALFENSSVKSQFHINIKKVASIIKKECGVDDWSKASEDKLMLRDKIHSNIALLADVINNNNEAVRIGIKKAKEELLK